MCKLNVCVEYVPLLKSNFSGDFNERITFSPKYKSTKFWSLSECHLNDLILDIMAISDMAWYPTHKYILKNGKFHFKG